MAVELTIEPPEAADEKVEVEMELSLAGVNEEQSISAPSDAKPLEGLFKEPGSTRSKCSKRAPEGGHRRPA